MSKVYDSFNFPSVTVEAAGTMGLTADEYARACEILGRTPNYIELGCVSAMWSEHCSYKSSRIHLKKLPTTGKDVVYGPGENAGVVRIDGDMCACFKVESHNHPSFIDPFHGAATGVGGILRDVFTMGARPVAAMNSLRFGTTTYSRTPALLKGVVEGIAHYGNCFGVPTVGGEIAFHPSYAMNPLVNAFVFGLVKEDKIFTAKASGLGNPVIYIGAKTGRDGIHGATMASEEFNEGSEKKRPKTQIGDPFKEKLLFEACLELMGTDVLVGIQDMGAAGLTSSSFEMAGRAGSGVVMHLDRVPMREEGMNPYEIMLSESQERMLLVAKKGREEEIIKTVHKWDLDAAVIGSVTDDGYVRLFWNGEEVATVPAAPLADGAPLYDRPHKRPVWLDDVANFDQSTIPVPDLEGAFLRLLSDPTIAGKRWVWEQYDHMVQLGTVSLPGSDAALVRLPEGTKGVAMSSDCNGRYCYLNPREGAKHAVAESARNVAASGARPVALTNCLNFGNPEKPDIMYQLVEAIEGIGEASRALNAPVVSGNVSLYNETEGKAIFPTPIIVMVGVMDDVSKRLESFFKKEGNRILFLGELPDKIDASHYLEVIHGKVAGAVPSVKLNFQKNLFAVIKEGAAAGVIESAHDLAEGGLAVAIFEMGTKNKMGADVKLPAAGRADAMLFGETPAMLLEVAPASAEAVKKLCAEYSVPCLDIGATGGKDVKIACGTLPALNVGIEKALALYEKVIPEMVK